MRNATKITLAYAMLFALWIAALIVYEVFK
jgi:hypothetical protein